jgi:catechol 2,3-dioxygenase-like lactoylglutathione lyase family enzyme
MELNTVRVFVDDIAAAKSFYANSLGLPLKHDGAEYGFCLFRPGGIDLLIEAVPKDAPADDIELVGRFTGLSFAVPDINATYTEMLAKGVKFTGEPERQPWGGILATFQDRAGNGLQLVQAAV